MKQTNLLLICLLTVILPQGMKAQETIFEHFYDVFNGELPVTEEDARNYIYLTQSGEEPFTLTQTTENGDTIYDCTTDLILDIGGEKQSYSFSLIYAGGNNLKFGFSVIGNSSSLNYIFRYKLIDNCIITFNDGETISWALSSKHLKLENEYYPTLTMTVPANGYQSSEGLEGIALLTKLKECNISKISFSKNGGLESSFNIAFYSTLVFKDLSKAIEEACGHEIIAKATAETQDFEIRQIMELLEKHCGLFSEKTSYKKAVKIIKDMDKQCTISPNSITFRYPNLFYYIMPTCQTTVDFKSTTYMFEGTFEENARTTARQMTADMKSGGVNFIQITDNDSKYEAIGTYKNKSVSIFSYLNKIQLNILQP